MAGKKEIIEKLKELKPILQRDYSVRQIGLFGSFAFDAANNESDIDLLVEFEKPIGWGVFSLEIYLEKVFNRKIDLVTKGALKKRIKENILNSVNYI